MIESIALTIISLSLLGYIFLQRKQEQTTREQDRELSNESFRDFLKHIEKLERMVLPQPVTVKSVKRVLSRIGEVSDEDLEVPVNSEPNEIEKEENKGVELPNDEWPSVITDKTKVMFEGDGDSPIVE